MPFTFFCERIRMRLGTDPCYFLARGCYHYGHISYWRLWQTDHDFVGWLTFNAVYVFCPYPSAKACKCARESCFSYQLCGKCFSPYDKKCFLSSTPRVCLFVTVSVKPWVDSTFTPLVLTIVKSSSWSRSSSFRCLLRGHPGHRKTVSGPLTCRWAEFAKDVLGVPVFPLGPMDCALYLRFLLVIKNGAWH